MAPKINFTYLEEKSGNHWHISAGGTRAYLLRFGEGIASMNPTLMDEQGADSHFMISRVQSALLLGGKELFQAEAVGRIFFESIREETQWFTQGDMPTSEADDATEAAYDWVTALSKHTMLRRAAADAHFALSHPHEAGALVYRGFEWLVLGEGRSWENLAEDLAFPGRTFVSSRSLPTLTTACDMPLARV